MKITIEELKEKFEKRYSTYNNDKDQKGSYISSSTQIRWEGFLGASRLFGILENKNNFNEDEKKAIKTFSKYVIEKQTSDLISKELIKKCLKDFKIDFPE